MKWHSFWVLQVRSSWLFNSLRIIQTNLQQWDLFPECFTQIVSSSWNYCNVKSSIAVGIFFSIYGFWLKPFEPFSVYADGSICLDILQNQWSPIYDVAAILTSIQVYWKTNLQYGYNCCVSIIARPLIEELLLLRSISINRKKVNRWKSQLTEKRLIVFHHPNRHHQLLILSSYSLFFTSVKDSEWKTNK